MDNFSTIFFMQHPSWNSYLINQSQTFTPYRSITEDSVHWLVYFQDMNLWYKMRSFFLFFFYKKKRSIETRAVWGNHPVVGLCWPGAVWSGVAESCAKRRPSGRDPAPAASPAAVRRRRSASEPPPPPPRASAPPVTTPVAPATRRASLSALASCTPARTLCRTGHTCVVFYLPTIGWPIRSISDETIM